MLERENHLRHEAQTDMYPRALQVNHSAMIISFGMYKLPRLSIMIEARRQLMSLKVPCRLSTRRTPRPANYIERFQHRGSVIDGNHPVLFKPSPANGTLLKLTHRASVNKVIIEEIRCSRRISVESL